jgi:hypothetical protein
MWPWAGKGWVEPLESGALLKGRDKKRAGWLTRAQYQGLYPKTRRAQKRHGQLARTLNPPPNTVVHAYTQVSK